MKTYQVTLPDEFATFVDRAVADGKFDTVDDLVLYAVTLAESDLRADEPADKEWLKKQLQVGLDQLDRGEVVDGPTFMAGLMDKVRAARKAP